MHRTHGGHMRRIVAATLVVPLLLAVTGCRVDEGANADNTPALAGPPPDPDQATATGNVRAAPADGRVPRIGLRKLVRVTRHALATKKGVHLDFEMRSRSLTVTGKGDEHLNPGTPALDEEIATSNARVPQILAVLTPGKMWVSVEGIMPAGSWAPVDVATSDGLFGPDSAVISSALDPMSAMMANRAGFLRLRYLGPSRLYGVPMAHYRLRVDGRRAVAGRGGSLATQQAMAGRFDYELWLDHDQLVRKLVLRLGGVRFGFEMSDWGKRVHVRLPRAGSLVAPPQAA
jgi:hypothetical protein